MMYVDFFLSYKDCNNVLRFRCNYLTYEFIHKYCKHYDISISDLLRQSLCNYFDDPEFHAICDQIDFNLDD